MLLGKVIGSVVATRKNEKLTGSKFLIIEGLHGCEPKRVVAVDNVGAGTDEIVLVTLGSAARVGLPAGTPVDAMVVGIVDGPDKIVIAGEA
ncbi:MAG: EutN/CcmL family microcompartment protein [Defluviitaleaceae bacterium]|nr:EutN/CcmL family microcompartment protein [Defluviitaleaceae bacterium]